MFKKQGVHPSLNISSMCGDTLALIMAGGKGTRLHQLTLRRAKPAVHFGGNYRVIDFTLSNCVNSGIHRIGVLTQYKSHSLIKHLQSGWSSLVARPGAFIEFLPADQFPENDRWYAGTADAVYQNIECIRAHRPRNVLILAGDHIYKMDYGPMLAHHVAMRAQVTIGCIEVPLAEAHDFGVIDMQADTRITRFTEKSPSPKSMPGKPDHALASMGIYVFDTQFLLECLDRDAAKNVSSRDFGCDVIPEAIRAGRVFAFPFRDSSDESRPGYWRDVGTIDTYWLANMELRGDRPKLDLYDESWPIWTHREWVPPAKFAVDAGGNSGTAMDSLVSGGCIVSGAAVIRSVLFVRSCVDAGSVVEDSLLLPGCRVGRGCHIRKAIIDAGCVIPDGMTVGINPEADALRFYRSPCDVTLVTRAMVEAVSSPAKSQYQQQSPAPPPVSPLLSDESTVELHSIVSRLDHAVLEPLSERRDRVHSGRRGCARKS